MSFSPQELAEQIRSARKNRELSLKQLADIAGIGKTAMFDLEHGNPGVRLNTLLSVLEKLNMDLALIHTDAVAAKSSGPQPTPSSSPFKQPNIEAAPVEDFQDSLPAHLL